MTAIQLAAQSTLNKAELWCNKEQTASCPEFPLGM